MTHFRVRVSAADSPFALMEFVVPSGRSFRLRTAPGDPPLSVDFTISDNSENATPPIVDPVIGEEDEWADWRDN